jgi:hypothetical protein
VYQGRARVAKGNRFRGEGLIVTRQNESQCRYVGVLKILAGLDRHCPFESYTTGFQYKVLQLLHRNRMRIDDKQ